MNFLPRGAEAWDWKITALRVEIDDTWDQSVPVLLDIGTGC